MNWEINEHTGGLFSILKFQILFCSTVRQYHFVNTPATWSEAQNLCRINYDDLATIDSMTKSVQLVESIGNADVSRLWIGLERRATEWWVWSEGIGEVTVFNWNVDKAYGDCVYMKPSIYWYANQCSDLKASLCFECKSEQWLVLECCFLPLIHTFVNLRALLKVAFDD